MHFCRPDNPRAHSSVQALETFLSGTPFSAREDAVPFDIRNPERTNIYGTSRPTKNADETEPRLFQAERSNCR
jgi:hypothetical protein